MASRATIAKGIPASIDILDLREFVADGGMGIGVVGKSRHVYGASRRQPGDQMSQGDLMQIAADLGLQNREAPSKLRRREGSDAEPRDDE